MAKQRKVKQTEKPSVVSGNLDQHIAKWAEQEALKREIETRRARNKGTARVTTPPVEP